MFWPDVYGLFSKWRVPLWPPWLAKLHRAQCGWWAAGLDNSPQLKESDSERWEDFGTKRWMRSPETQPCCFLRFSPGTSISCCCLPSGVLWLEWCCSESTQWFHTCTDDTTVIHIANNLYILLFLRSYEVNRVIFGFFSWANPVKRPKPAMYWLY